MLPFTNQIVYLSTTNKHEFILKTRIAEVNNQHICIELPINERTGKMERIPIGRNVILFFQTKDHGEFMFPTTIIDEKKDNIDLLVLSLPSPDKIKKAQRRGFLRVPASIETSFRIIGNTQKDWILVKTLDISGGGMQIVVPSTIRLREGLGITGWISIPFTQEEKVEHVPYEADIVRIITPEENAKNHWISLKFTNITEVSRAKIIRYSYQRQVQLRKKGLI